MTPAVCCFCAVGRCCVKLQMGILLLKLLVSWVSSHELVTMVCSMWLWRILCCSVWVYFTVLYITPLQQAVVFYCLYCVVFYFNFWFEFDVDLTYNCVAFLARLPLKNILSQLVFIWLNTKNAENLLKKKSNHICICI